jgi:hypothetical protein
VSSSPDAEVTVVDGLSWEPGRRQSVEAAIRLAFQGMRGGPWVVTLGPPTSPDPRVSVSVRGPQSMLLTSFALDATPAQITDRLKGAMQTAS